MFRSKYWNTEQSSQQVKLSSPVKAVVYFRCILAHVLKTQNTSALKPLRLTVKVFSLQKTERVQPAGGLTPPPPRVPSQPSGWRHLSVCLQRDRNAVIRAQPEHHDPSGSANSSGLELKRLELRADNELNAAGARCWRRRARASRTSRLANAGNFLSANIAPANTSQSLNFDSGFLLPPLHFAFSVLSLFLRL